MPFGFSKKDKDSNLDAQKASLFGKNSRSPAPQSSNPYANPPPSNDPYAQRNANPYASQNSQNDPYASRGPPQPPTAGFNNLSLNKDRGPSPSPQGNSQPGPNSYGRPPAPQNGYGGGGGGGAPRYGNPGGYGQGSGYGSDAYGGAGASGGNPYGNTSSRAGGYGGLTRTASQDTMSTDAGRNALFGDAPKRAQRSQEPPPQAGASQERPQDTSYSNSGGYDSAEMPGGYGGPGRELSAEEQEEQDVQAAKNEIRFIKKQDVSSIRNVLRMAQQSEQTGLETLARLGAQGERIHNTERNLDSASNQNRLAEEKARELRTLNRSMFAVHVANPFNAKARERAADDLAVDKRHTERNMAEETRAEAFRSQARQQEQHRNLRSNNGVSQNNKNSLLERSKYQFEPDSEDEADENEIQEGLEMIHQRAQFLGKIGKAMGDELDSQNRHLERITKKTDKVDDEITLNRARLDRIK